MDYCRTEKYKCTSYAAKYLMVETIVVDILYGHLFHRKEEIHKLPCRIFDDRNDCF